MAVKCDNCERPACYTTADPGVNPANYCSSCLPYWLHERANLGHFPLVDALDQTPKEEETAKAKKKAPAKAAPSEDSN